MTDQEKQVLESPDSCTVTTQDKYHLRLYIMGASPNSVRAVANIKAFCEKYLPGMYLLEIIDVHQQPEIAEDEEIIALPLLVKKHPLPVRKLIGDMSDVSKVLRGLGIQQ